MPKVAFDNHKEFMRVSKMVSEALTDIAHKLDCIDELHQIRPHTDRVADDMTKLLLRAWDINHQ